MVERNAETPKRRNGETSKRRNVETGPAVQLEPSARLAPVWRALESVTDPEIPVLNVVEMGIIAGVRVEADAIVVDMTPTFAGCPALDVIRADIHRAVEALGETRVTVRTVYDPPWTTARMTDSARRKLKEFGLAPPAAACPAHQRLDETLAKVPCPFCDSTNTELESLFGPTLCRTIHYCHACRQSFENFKTV